MAAITNSYNGKFYTITKKSKNEKVEEDGLLVSWVCWVWNLNENRFVTSKSLASSIRGRSKVLSLLKTIIETHVKNRPLTKVSKINDNHYEGHEGSEKMIEWEIEERNDLVEDIVVSLPVFYRETANMNNTIYESLEGMF